MDTTAFWSLIPITLIALSSVKVVRRNERLVLIRGGKPVKVAGPGVALALPFKESVKRINVSTITCSVPAVRDERISNTLLTAGTFTYRVTDPLKAAMKEDLRAAILLEVVSALKLSIGGASFNDCLRECRYLERSAMELMNKQSRSFGVEITNLRLTDFPLHRQLLASMGQRIGAVSYALTVTFAAINGL